jgi:molybdenum cofactor guanylyltransferase
MGRDKARLRLGNRTLLGHVRAAAQATRLPVRIIKEDMIPRCGPLGGIYTGLNSSGCTAVLFLACDMPFVDPAFLQLLFAHASRRAVFFCHEQRGAGFPFLLRKTAFNVVFEQLRQRQYSLQNLAKALKAKLILPPPTLEWQLTNVNTPAQWRAALRQWRLKR